MKRIFVAVFLFFSASVSAQTRGFQVDSWQRDKTPWYFRQPRQVVVQPLVVIPPVPQMVLGGFVNPYLTTVVPNVLPSYTIVPSLITYPTFYYPQPNYYFMGPRGGYYNRYRFVGDLIVLEAANAIGEILETITVDKSYRVCEYRYRY